MVTDAKSKNEIEKFLAKRKTKLASSDESVIEKKTTKRGGSKKDKEA